MHSARKWMYFPIPIHYKFRTPSSTLGGDGHVRPLSFLWKIELPTTFTCNIFWFNRYFLQRSVLKWIYFPNQYIIILQTWQCLEPLASLTPRGDGYTRSPSFFYSKFNAQQLLFEAFLDTKRIFCSVQP